MSIPNIFETSYMLSHGVRNSNQIMHGDQTKGEEFFTWSTMSILAENFCTMNADTWSVCGS